MPIKIERVPLENNEKVLTDFWSKYIHDWRIDPYNYLLFIQPVVKNVWLYLAYNNEEFCGVLVNEESDSNAIWLLFVRPHLRRMGIGSALFNSALSKVNGVWRAGLGSEYWWQGVPEGYGDEFLENRGFEWSWTSVDMLMNLNTYSMRGPETLARIRKINRFEAVQLIDMLKNENDLCNWVSIYQTLFDSNQYEKVFVACEGTKIIGCAILLDKKDIRWSKNFSGRTGGISCIGVMKSYREKGIGEALVLSLTNELKHLGFEQSYIGYTWLEDWYGKFGYRTIYRFKMGQKKI